MKTKKVILSLLICFGTISAQAGSFKVTLGGSPEVVLTLDRDYQVMEVSKSDGTLKGRRVYMFIPQDGQSSAVFGIGDGGNKKTEESIKDGYEGAKIERVSRPVYGHEAEWWHYRDSRHLYSTCYVSVSDRNGTTHQLTIDLVANSIERLSALEAAFAGLTFKDKVPNNPVQETPAKAAAPDL